VDQVAEHEQHSRSLATEEFVQTRGELLDLGPEAAARNMEAVDQQAAEMTICLQVIIE
jgi:hypothetical protein